MATRVNASSVSPLLKWRELEAVLQSADASDKLVAIAFTALHCPDCHKLEPLLPALSLAFPAVQFCRVDVAKAPALQRRSGAGTLTPTVLLYRRRSRVAVHSGPDILQLRMLLADHGGRSGMRPPEEVLQQQRWQRYQEERWSDTTPSKSGAASSTPSSSLSSFAAVVTAATASGRGRVAAGRCPRPNAPPLPPLPPPPRQLRLGKFVLPGDTPASGGSWLAPQMVDLHLMASHRVDITGLVTHSTRSM